MAILENEYFVVTIDRDTDNFFTGDKIPGCHVDLSGSPVAEYFQRPPESDFPVTGPLMKGGPRYLISRSIYEAIKNYEQRGVQFLPVTVNVNENENIIYHVVNFYEKMDWVDLDSSIYDSADLTLSGVEKLVLNKNAMELVSYEDKKIFSITSCPELMIFHESVVDSIVSYYQEMYDDEVDGIKFTPLSEYKKP